MYTGPNIITDGLVLAVDASNFKSYPGTGTLLNDLSGNGAIGTLTNGPVWSNYINNTSNIFVDGTNDYINFGDILDMGTDSVTTNVWVRPNGTQPNSSWILTKLSVAAANTNSRYGTGFLANTYKARAQFKYNAFTFNSNATTQLTNNIFQLVTTVFDRSGEVDFYYNGELQPKEGSYAISAGSGTSINSTAPYRIGSYTSTDNVTPVGMYRGYIGSAYQYNRVLLQTEIKQLYNATKTRFGL